MTAAVARLIEPRLMMPRETTDEAAAPQLEVWRADALDDEVRATVERPEDLAAAYSGYWWSTPTQADLVTTSRQAGRLPAVQLDLVEESMGWRRAHVARVSECSRVRDRRSVGLD